ncbi:hypothetical protein ACTNDG_08985 [Clostridium sp. HCP1S3_B4]|uniref:hypothetical protein n=1 Tax=unclassified Clostridium TaxID=2614128 RepID=UPI0016B49B36|nr:hypothetical protein [Clostridiales bacterium]MDY2728888.1 hypothetical protein [Clostridium sp.]NLK23484.1 hypothetical protein [Clostridiales bacterium]
MKKRFWLYVFLILTAFIGIIPLNNKCAYASENNTHNYEIQDNQEKVSNTFDIKKIVPEIIVIIVAGGVLLFCITKES